MRHKEIEFFLEFRRAFAQHDNRMTQNLALALPVQKCFKRFFTGLLRNKTCVRIEFGFIVFLRGAQIVLGLGEPTRRFAFWIFHKS